MPAPNDPPPESSTSSHPAPSAPDPTTNNTPTTTTTTSTSHAAQGRQPAARPTSPTELARLKVSLKAHLRQYPDFPTPGILFEDIMPLFADPACHANLVRAHELQLATAFARSRIDVVVGLESRGFLVGPTLALRLGAGFVPVRKRGKLPGPTVTASFRKEYGEDHFQMQAGAIKPGQTVVVLDDIIATGE